MHQINICVLPMVVTVPLILIPPKPSSKHHIHYMQANGGRAMPTGRSGERTRVK